MSDLIEDLQEVIDILQPSPLVCQIYQGIAEIKRLRKGNLIIRERVNTALIGWKKILKVVRENPAAYPDSQAAGSVKTLTEVLKWIDAKIPNLPSVSVATSPENPE